MTAEPLPLPSPLARCFAPSLTLLADPGGPDFRRVWTWLRSLWRAR